MLIYSPIVMIQAINLKKSYGDVTAVDGVSFEIKAGESFGLLGPNGAGKTTTILLLIGALTADSGEAEIDGKRDPGRADVRRRLGIAPQQLAVYEELTGEENLAFFGKLYSMSGSRLKERVDWALEFAGLTERRKSRASTYSGGMKRRINLACAMVHDRPVILLDEPTVGVDPQSRNHIFEIIESLQKEARTILYTTHYMEEVQRLCDRVAIMDHGKILALESVENLISAHGGNAVVEARLERPLEDGRSLPFPAKGTSLRWETAKPLEEVAQLSSAGAKLTSLRVDQPDLEAVFLSLTGRSLRD